MHRVSEGRSRAEIDSLTPQDVVADPEGLTPPFWQHVRLYGEVRPDVVKCLPPGGAVRAPRQGGPWWAIGKDTNGVSSSSPGAAMVMTSGADMTVGPSSVLRSAPPPGRVRSDAR
ncbi:hypothetical protein ABT340_19215 [Streptosporangium sp. NPDC000239]|uniref:hypothetical protein n=1 Tax=Streptosporangium sp. NPDC000239 TaxID=3154248 RepID=UPI00332B43F3